MAEFADLLQSQIKEHCKLALPEGLKELMADISREVLRAQPEDIYGFITKYLAALLVSRENLSIAARVCQDVCQSTCHPELESKLKDIGLNEEDVTTAKEIIDKYFSKGGDNEQTLMLRLMARTNLSNSQLAPLRDAIREAFLEHQFNKTRDDIASEMTCDDDQISRAAKHTMQLYAKTGPSEVDFNQKATQIQAAYRAYGVRRLCPSKPGEEKKERKNIQFITQIPEIAEDSKVLGPVSSESDYDVSSLLDEKEVSAINFMLIEPKRLTESNSIIKTMDFDTQTDHRNLHVVSKVSFIDPLLVPHEIPKQTIDEESLSLEEDYTYDGTRTSEIKLSRNSHNILEDVAKHKGNIGLALPIINYDEDEVSKPSEHDTSTLISHVTDVESTVEIANIKYDIAEQDSDSMFQSSDSIMDSS